MKFNHKLLSLSLGAALMTFTACTDDKLTGEDNSTVDNGKEWVPSGKTVFVSTGIKLPSGNFGRSATDEVGDNGGQTNSNADPDFEYGHAYENEVNNVILIFTNSDNKYVAQSIIKTVSDAAPENAKFDFHLNAELSYDELERAYDAGLLGTGENKIVHIYAFCNYTSRMYERFQDLAKTDPNDAMRSEWIDWEGIVDEDPSPAWEKPTITNSIWSRGSFTMTNASVTDFVFPDSISKWEPWTDMNTPYIANSTGQQYKTGNSGDRADPTPIKVERVSARIDFKDGSKGDNTYPIEVVVEKGQTPKEYYEIKLTRMSLVNMNKKYYYLRRVSKTGLNAGAEVGGVETSTNFVVDYFAGLKNTVEGINTTNADTIFNFPLYGKTQDINDPIDYDRTQWFSKDIVDILDNNDQTDTWGETHNYKIWRYVTENTIPTVDQQKTIQSTGVIFKGAIHPGKDLTEENAHVSETVRKALELGAEKQPEWVEGMVVLYDYQNVLYGSIAELVDSANTNGANSPLYNKIYRILRHWKYDQSTKTYTYDPNEADGLSVEVADRILNPETYEALQTDTLYNNYIKGQNIKIDFDYTGTNEMFKDSYGEFMNKEGQFMALCAEHDITVYMPSNEQDTDGWGYYCYYPYWIRHNDNNKSGMMGPMEFAVVRNNVYKLSVSKISRFGYPRAADVTPDPIHPEDPDEDPSVYITVEVEVLPWVVRVNDIQF